MTFKSNINQIKDVGVDLSQFCEIESNRLFVVDNQELSILDLESSLVVSKLEKTDLVSDICYSSINNAILTASDNKIIGYSTDFQNKIVYSTPNNLDVNILSSAINNCGHLIVAGCEVESKLFNEKNVSIMIFWDVRNSSVPLGFYKDSHGDSITSLEFQPNCDHMLLSGGQDQMNCVYDLRFDNEEDALIEQFKSEGLIHKNGWLPQNNLIYSLSNYTNQEFWQTDTFDKIKCPCELPKSINNILDCTEICDYGNEIATLTIDEDLSVINLSSKNSLQHKVNFKSVTSQSINYGKFIKAGTMVCLCDDNNIYICN